MKRRRNAPGGVELLERAWALLRRIPVGLWAVYYLGALPFILGLLYFWADMSRSAWAADRAAPASLGLALLFFWMKAWHHAFGRGLLAELGGLDRAASPGGSRYSRAAAGILVHGAGLFLLPLSLITAFSFPWTYAFWQTYTVQPARPGEGLRASIGRAWTTACRNPGQNHVLLAVLFFFGLAVLANIVGALALGPVLLKSLLGVETTLVRTWRALFNTTFLVLALGLAWLCLDPLVKAVYALRCFRSESRLTGADIRVDLHRAAREGNQAAVIIAVLLIAALWLIPVPAFAAATSNANKVAAVSTEELGRSIETVISEPQYAWRLPREKPAEPEDEEPGLVGRFFKWLGEKTRAGLKAMEGWIEDIAQWWDDLWPDRQRTKPKPRPLGGLPGSWPYVLLYGGLTVVLCVLAVFLYRYYLRRRKEILATPLAAIAAAPDLADDSVSAADLPEDQWLELARGLAAEGDLRLALRALYLASLARLADNDLITLARYKSNLEYRRELDRRARGRAELVELFALNTGRVDRALYSGRNGYRRPVPGLCPRSGPHPGSGRTVRPAAICRRSGCVTGRQCSCCWWCWL